VKSVYSARYRALMGRLKRARLEAGLTQAKAATALGRPQSFISKCESGERRIDPVELERLSKLYGKPLHFFLPEEEGA
jgi:transcriptional regulator with XRE-family HTH domain